VNCSIAIPGIFFEFFETPSFLQGILAAAAMNIQASPAGRSVFGTALIDDIRDSLSLEYSGKGKARRAGANDSNPWAS
jgi:hypothetical protein